MDYIKVDLPYRKKSKILALGAQSKSSFCFVKEGVAFLSRSFGDLGGLENFKLFQDRIRRENKKLNPKIIACDLHPEYSSTRFAFEISGRDGQRVIQIQHHEAHIASCIADNNVKGNIIGIAFDGTGFGSDGNIWGGEFFVGTIGDFKRRAHLQYIHMPGGEACITKPRRMALSYLYSIYQKQGQTLFLSMYNKNCKKIVSVPVLGVDKRELELIIQLIHKRLNSPLTSSMGRLFDAVSALVGICTVAEYEGQAAVELEKALLSFLRKQESKDMDSRFRGNDNLLTTAYNFNIVKDKEVLVVVPDRVIKGIVKDVRDNVPVGLISLKFHNAICNMVKDVCKLLRKRYSISKVCLSGGVFQNRYLREHVKSLLEEQRFKVYLHRNIPTHDGGISLGQAVIARGISI